VRPPKGGVLYPIRPAALPPVKGEEPSLSASQPPASPALNSRLVTQVAFLLLTAAALNWYLGSVDPEDTSIPLSDTDPDLYLKVAQISRFDEAGRLMHQVQASRFTHYPHTDVTTLIGPSVTLHGDDDLPWRIQSRSGRILPLREGAPLQLELWDSVVIEKSTSDGGFIHIRSEDLTVLPEEQYAETDRRVIIDNPESRTVASGMKANLKPGHFSFYSSPGQPVTTTIIPRPRGR
jgi:lipopolysaccharide export system protein LptC